MKEQNKKVRREDGREEEDNNRSHGEGTPIYLTSNSTLQSPEEHAHDQTVDPRNDTTREVSGDDLWDSKAGKLTGRDGVTDPSGNENDSLNS